MTAAPPFTPAALARAYADQVAELYANWHRTSLSMLLGAAILCLVLWDETTPIWMAGWLALIVANQAWRGLLVRAWKRARPGLHATLRWGRYWTIGSTTGGALWGLASIVMFPPSQPHQALLIVCLFGVVLGGLNLTAVYRPAFYGFTLLALTPLIVRVALEGDRVHGYIAFVMGVVMVFILAFGHQLNALLTRSLAMRYENLDLIDELKAKSRAAREAQAAAEGANRSKSQLLAAASHDLRQPLHALGLYVAALAMRATDAEWRPLVASIQRGLGALEGQFEQLLDLSRLEAGALAPAPARMALAPVLMRVADGLRAQAQAKGLDLRVAPTRLAIHSDAALFERIVRNLVANAIRYTERGGIVLGARRRGASVATDVVDTGVGIATPLQERIFDEFYQVPTSRSSAAHGGLGLGLAIVRRLAVLLDHRVEVRSLPGRGSRFRVYAPYARAAAYARGGPPPARTGGGATPAGAIRGALVAVVDDDPCAVDAMRALFTTWGADVAGGSDVGDLLVAIGRADRYPDFVVADLRLAHGASGIAAVGRLRDELGIALPALLVSGDTSPAALRDARHAGIVLLGKPVVPAALHAAASSLLVRA
ncbi:MAG: hybrid sensor histidine kinase/response regulator [Burkholderiales bacterium]|nr:hybrid sensor histidine kinase/response regulator [Burkholderiales bacterium]